MIEVEHLYKSYDDDPAVKDLSFSIEEGHVYGFLGPNGAGKSTTMNIITGCLSADSGKVTVGGNDIFEQPEKAKRMIGYLPEHPPLYPSETPEEYLRFVGEAKGLKGSELKAQVDKVIERTGTGHVRKQLISTLSKGYKQRVGIAQALLGDPKVIILDEPTVGLDPLQLVEIRQLIKDLGKEHTVLFSSHILSEVQAICDKVMIISGGKLVAFSDTDKLGELSKGTATINVAASATKEQLQAVLGGFLGENAECSYSEDEGGIRCSISLDTKDVRSFCSELFFRLADASVPVYELSAKSAGLEDIFLELTEKGGETDDSSVQTRA